MPRRALCWLRRDLRLEDHAALHAATAQADEVFVVFVFDSVILNALADRDDRRLTLIQRSLEEVHQGLVARGSGLLVRHGDPVEVIPHLAQELGVESVFAARDYEPYARRRDPVVSTRLEELGVSLTLVQDHVTIEPDEVRSLAGTPFTVFTPFSKAWRARFTMHRAAELTPDFTKLATAVTIQPHRWDYTLADIGFQEASLFVTPGESGGRAALEAFQVKMARYGDDRDFPALDGTSVLSPHLRFGTVSVRAAVRAALAENSPGSEKWLSELIWREFYQHVLWHFPHVENSSFRPEFESVVWPGDRDHLDAWKEGRTGYPIVDAAMRSFSAQGWLHNRLRMVVASFLVKDLLLDYRLGEAHFARYLLDFELASNNGGWQWSASTGCDAQPYFRIFNPVLQSRKFDASGAFIRRWVPELAGFPDEQIHEPWVASLMEQLAAGCEIGKDYPAPIVEHRVQKELAVKLLEAARGGSAPA